MELSDSSAFQSESICSNIEVENNHKFKQKIESQHKEFWSKDGGTRDDIL